MLKLKDKLSQNELRIFRAVYETGPVSRVRVSRGLHLTRAAVSINIKRLKKLGLISEVGKGISSERRGRREVLLAVNPEAGYIISIHFSLNNVAYGITDLGGKVLHGDTLRYALGTQPDEILPGLVKNIKDLLNSRRIDRNKVFGTGVAIPGIINYPDGAIGESTLPGWEAYPLAAFLSDALDCEVYVDNDVKVLTLGEFQFGTSRHISNLICLWLENGIGAGFIIEGRLVRGATSSAGEIGFNEFLPESSIRQSIFADGNPRCWGDILSITHIQNTINRGIKEGWKTILTEDAELSDFVKAVETRDPLAVFIFKSLASIISTVCRNLVYTFNPQSLVLSGPLFNQLPLLAEEVRSTMTSSHLKRPMEAVELKISILGQNGILIGCVALLLEHLFKTSDQKSMFSMPHYTEALLE